MKRDAEAANANKACELSPIKDLQRLFCFDFLMPVKRPEMASILFAPSGQGLRTIRSIASSTIGTEHISHSFREGCGTITGIADAVGVCVPISKSKTRAMPINSLLASVVANFAPGDVRESFTKLGSE